MKFSIKDQDLGVWIDSADMTLPEFNVAIVDLAITAGLSIEPKAWVKRKKKYLSSKATQVTLEELEQVKESSLEYLNRLMPDTHEFVVQTEKLVINRKS